MSLSSGTSRIQLWHWRDVPSSRCESGRQKFPPFLLVTEWKPGQLKEYRMTVHLFGASSSPSCANFALKTTAETFRNVNGNETSDFVQRDFYVDDGLKSVRSSVEAYQLILDSHELCKLGDFNLHKFICNDKTVLDTIPQSLQATNVRNLDLTCDQLR